MLPKREIGCNLEPETSETYKSEWELYTSFCQRIGEHQVPGRDKPWRIDVVSRYLWWRQNCNSWRTLAGVKSKLKHCGLCHGYLLPTAERDGSTKMRLQLAMVTQVIKKKQIKKKKNCENYFPKMNRVTIMFPEKIQFNNIIYEYCAISFYLITGKIKLFRF